MRYDVYNLFLKAFINQLFCFITQILHENFITSSKIREAFPDIKPGTLEQRLRDLANQKLLIKREREYGLAEDKIEYKLSERGLLELKKLITKYPHILKSI
ncbi:hypothetical protein ES703_61410 [subsurface metagenome]